MLQARAVLTNKNQKYPAFDSCHKRRQRLLSTTYLFPIDVCFASGFLWNAEDVFDYSTRLGFQSGVLVPSQADSRFLRGTRHSDPRGA